MAFPRKGETHSRSMSFEYGFVVYDEGVSQTATSESSGSSSSAETESNVDVSVHESVTTTTDYQLSAGRPPMPLYLDIVMNALLGIVVLYIFFAVRRRGRVRASRR